MRPEGTPSHLVVNFEHLFKCKGLEVAEFTMKELIVTVDRKQVRHEPVKYLRQLEQHLSLAESWVPVITKAIDNYRFFKYHAPPLLVKALHIILSDLKLNREVEDLQ